jgi:hypothetical protein
MEMQYDIDVLKRHLELLERQIGWKKRSKNLMVIEMKRL